MDLAPFRSAVAERTRYSLTTLDALAPSPRERVALTHMLAPAKDLLRSGKRTRAALLGAGYVCATDADLTPAVIAGAAQELYQASALIHDDVIDASPTRRGKLAAHKAFERMHHDEEWVSTPNAFGVSAAITLGDLLLPHAISVFSSALTPSSDPRTLSTFIDMTTEVAYGQFLDIRAENLPFSTSDDALEEAQAVLTHKSARYSVELPLVLGALLGGGSPKLVSELHAIGAPLGEAFQLRDDHLGIFGNPETTGKPACGDITEGKRTVLLALTRAMSNPDDRHWLEQQIGRKLSESDTERIRSIVVASGAHDRHEEMIVTRENAAVRAIAECTHARIEGIDALHELIAELRGRIA